MAYQKTKILVIALWLVLVFQVLASIFSVRAESFDLVDVSSMVNLRAECVSMAQHIKNSIPNTDTRYKASAEKINRVEAAANAYIDQVVFRLQAGGGPSNRDLLVARDLLISRAQQFLNYGGSLFKGRDRGAIAVVATLAPALVDIALRAYQTYQASKDAERQRIREQIEGLRFLPFEQV